MVDRETQPAVVEAPASVRPCGPAGRRRAPGRWRAVALGCLVGITACNKLPGLGKDRNDAQDQATGVATELDGGVEGDTSADPPSEVTGTFLTGCGPVEGAGTAITDVYGCGIYEPETGKRFAGQADGIVVELHRADGKVRKPRLRPAGGDSSWHVEFTLLKGAIGGFAGATVHASLSIAAKPGARAYSERVGDFDYRPSPLARDGRPERITVAAEVDESLTTGATDDAGLLPDAGGDGGGGDTGTGTASDSGTGTGTGSGTGTDDGAGAGSLSLDPHAVITSAGAGSVSISGTCYRLLGPVTVTIGAYSLDIPCGVVTGTFSATGLNLASVLLGGANTVSLQQSALQITKSATGSLRREVVLAVSARYPTHGANWLDYVAVTGGGGACSGAAQDTITDCVHGGERRLVDLSALQEPCSALTFEEDLGAFLWQCLDDLDGNGTTGDVALVSLGLAPGKHLSDLLQALPLPAFRENRIQVKKGGSVIAASPLAVWWSNPVMALAVDGSNRVLLKTVKDGGTFPNGVIFVYNASLVMRGLELASEKIAVVGIGDTAKLTQNASMRSELQDCPAGSGFAGAKCSVAMAAPYTWFEGRITGIRAGSNRDAALTVTRPFVRLDHVEIDRDFIGVLLGNTKMVRATDLRLHDIADAAMMIDNSDMPTEGRHVVIGLRATYSDLGLNVLNSSANSIALASLTNNTTGGARLLGADSTVIARSVVANNGGVGITANAASNVVFKAMTVANNFSGGLNVDTSSAQHEVTHLATVNNGVSGLSATASNSTVSDKLRIRHLGVGLGQGAALTLSSDTVVMQGKLKFAVNWGDGITCNLTGSSQAYLNGQCQDATLGTGFEGQIAVSTAGTGDFGLAFAGNLFEQASPTEAHLFYVPPTATALSGWGLAEEFQVESPNMTYCPLGSLACRFWNWRLSAASVLAYVVGPAVAANASCPTYVLPTGDSHPNLSQGAAYLDDALEILGDGRGDEDGLCDNGEACFAAQHLGADQGVPDYGPTDKRCVYPEATSMGAVTMYLPD